MKKEYICPVSELNKIETSKFICTSTIVDGPDGPTGSVSDDDETPTDDDALSKSWSDVVED